MLTGNIRGKPCELLDTALDAMPLQPIRWTFFVGLSPDRLPSVYAPIAMCSVRRAAPARPRWAEPWWRWWMLCQPGNSRTLRRFPRWWDVCATHPVSDVQLLGGGNISCSPGRVLGLVAFLFRVCVSLSSFCQVFRMNSRPLSNEPKETQDESAWELVKVTQHLLASASSPHQRRIAVRCASCFLPALLSGLAYIPLFHPA